MASAKWRPFCLDLSGLEVCFQPTSNLFTQIATTDITRYLVICSTLISTGRYQIKESVLHACVSVYCPVYGAFDLGLAESVPLPIVTGIFVLLWFQSRLT